jgi:AraC-like DNA-binding protein
MKPAHSHLGAYAITWLTVDPEEPASAPLAPDSFERVHYDLPPDLGRAFVERVDAGSDIQIFRGVHALEPAPRRLVQLLDVDARFNEPMFNAQIWLSGGGCHREYWQGRAKPPSSIWAGPGRDTFRWHQDYQATVLVEGGVHSEMRSVVISHATLAGLLGEAEADMLINGLGLSRSRPAVVRSMPAFVSMALRDPGIARFSGPALRLFGQAKVLEYLAVLYSVVTDDTPAKPQPRHANRLRQLHDQLLAAEGRLPTLSELAVEYGLSARTLNAMFTAMYGEPIVKFITHQRLQQAHAALLETTVPIKALAVRLGYSHVNHFSIAFKRKFGYPPSALRRGSSAT